jgi:hypothetical protein
MIYLPYWIAREMTAGEPHFIIRHAAPMPAWGHSAGKPALILRCD